MHAADRLTLAALRDPNALTRMTCDPVKQARRLAKFRTLPLHRRVRAFELYAVLGDAGRVTRL